MKTTTNSKAGGSSWNGPQQSENPVDKIVRRLDEFPELVQALRDGDFLTGRLVCAQLFDPEERRNCLGDASRTLQLAMKAF
jgi:hypothetical protein